MDICNRHNAGLGVDVIREVGGSMIIAEITTIGGKGFKHHYSDTGHKIRQIGTGIVYDDAMDVLSSNYAYEETDELIVKDEGE